MSALLATANPRRIKATHRRRGKCTAAHRVYANNNPYRFTDPDGRVAVPVLIAVGIGLYLMSDYANAPDVGEKPTTMSNGERVSQVVGALPATTPIAMLRSTIGLTQRAANREAKRQAGIPTSQQPTQQTNGRASDGTPVGRQQTYETPKPGGGTETKSVQVSRDTRGDHAGMPQVEAGTVKPNGQVDQAGRPRIQNEGKVRVDFEPEL